MATQIQLRRDTAANWTSTNPTLTQGEPGYETDTGKIKYGDGSTAWNSLAYASGGLPTAFAAGSAAAPGLAIDGDSNTGIYSPGADQVAVATNGAGRLFVNASGNVGIGTTSPGVNLQVQNDSSFSLIRVVASSGNVAGIDFGDAADTDTAGVRYDNVSDSMAFRVNASERGRFDASGRLLVGTSSANANGGILQLSSGITFPATAVAASDVNTLDDYEEGTWTPTVGGTATYTKNTGNYTKLGRLVNVSFELYINTIGTGSQWQIFGLPFTVTSTGSHSAGGGVGFVNGLATNVASTFLRADSADTYLVLASLTAAGTFSGNNNIIGNSTRIMASISYMT